MSTHALLSPSGAARWMCCPGSVALESVLPDSSSDFADEGTAAHELAALALTEGKDCMAYYGRQIEVNGKHYAVDMEMVENVQAYVDRTRAIGGELFVEQRLSIQHLTGEDDAYGTSDAVIVAGTELVIRDLKYGRGVKVDAAGNEQLRIYALAALAEFELVYEIETVRLCIDQPRLGYVSEDVMPVDELREFAARVAVAASVCDSLIRTHQDTGTVDVEHLNPGEKQCQFCRAKATCPALRNHVLTTVADDFVDLDEPIAPQLAHAADRVTDNALLGNLMGAVDLIEAWCKAVRGKVEAELFAGNAVPGYKLVEGRRGARQWGNPADAEALMKTMRMKTEEMYDLKIISPTTAEKLHKAGKIGPRQWPKVQELITQADGKPSVAPESDKRPALVMQAAEDDFDDETAPDLV